jgi:hypothetical protein
MRDGENVEYLRQILSTYHYFLVPCGASAWHSWLISSNCDNHWLIHPQTKCKIIANNDIYKRLNVLCRAYRLWPSETVRNPTANFWRPSGKQAESKYFSCQCWAKQPLTSPCEKKKKTPWSESASELYRPSDRLLSAKWLPTFADRGCHVVSVTDP